MKTWNGTTYSTFQEAAKASGIIENERECIMSFTENILFSTPSELRHLFILLTTQGYSTLQIYNDMDLRITMMQDYIDKHGVGSNIELSEHDLLTEFHELLMDSSK